MLGNTAKKPPKPIRPAKRHSQQQTTAIEFGPVLIMVLATIISSNRDRCAVLSTPATSACVHEFELFVLVQSRLFVSFRAK